jgi:two-component system NarL family sensor kinase
MEAAMSSVRTGWRYVARTITGASFFLIIAGILLWVIAIIRADSLIGLFSHQATTPISGAVFALMGGVVMSRHPRHPIGWILAGLGMIASVEVLNLGVLAFASARAPGAIIPAPAISHWLANWIYIPRAMIPVTILLLFFPDGRLPSRRWRLVAWAAGIDIAVLTIATAFEPSEWEAMAGVVQNPYAIQSTLLNQANAVSSGLLTLALLASIASVFVRFRKATEPERQQLKWMTYALGFVLFIFVGMVIAYTFASESPLVIHLALTGVNIALIAIALAVGIAILRFRLYDIDLVINRTLVYGALTVTVVSLYIGVVGSLGAIFQTRGNLLISLTATGLIAVLFQPLRDRLQRGVNRLLYGRRDEPYVVLSQMGRSMESAHIPEVMYGTIVGTVAESLKLPYVAIELADGQIVGESGQPVGLPLSFPLTYQDQRLGDLICSPRTPDDSFTGAEIGLLEDIANQAALAVHALGLSAALQRSREQLVSAREEERRRLRRDLHDGLGPQLASLALKLDATRNQLKNDPKAVDALLLQLRRDTQDAIADVRRLVYNLRPPVLDELGLIPALRAGATAQLTSPKPHVVIEGPESLPALPAAVEVAAYRIVQEALTNVVRHAQAEHCTVRLYLNNGLELEVLDDGVGLPAAYTPGVGLNSMRERTAELGGEFTVEGLPDGGSRVYAHFPLSLGGA